MCANCSGWGERPADLKPGDVAGPNRPSTLRGGPLPKRNDREWHIVFDLNGRNESELLEAVELLLCGPDHPQGENDCLLQWLSCSPAPAEATASSVEGSSTANGGDEGVEPFQNPASSG